MPIVRSVQVHHNAQPVHTAKLLKDQFVKEHVTLDFIIAMGFAQVI